MKTISVKDQGARHLVSYGKDDGIVWSRQVNSQESLPDQAGFKGGKIYTFANGTAYYPRYRRRRADLEPWHLRGRHRDRRPDALRRERHDLVHDRHQRGASGDRAPGDPGLDAACRHRGCALPGHGSDRAGPRRL
ncbi:MAG TPA: hypothetical protein VE597_06585 [Geminicoccaceae bacterium]|jgi:hypothetical protein|nr:hypothetical protein [Geminicoccaceae bacterium]